MRRLGSLNARNRSAATGRRRAIRSSDREVPAPLLDTLHDAQVSIHCVAQDIERLLIRGAVVRGDRLRNAREFDQDGALGEAALVAFRSEERRVGKGWT